MGVLLLLWLLMGEKQISEAYEEYQGVYLPALNLSPRTRIEYSNDLQDLFEFVESQGCLTTGQISLALLDRYLAELENRGFASTTRKRKAIVSGLS